MNRMNLKPYVEACKDDLHAAIDGLNAFTKNWCMNVKLTEKREDLSFRCDKCIFSIEGNCLIKKFAYDKDEEYTRTVDFGCMGLL
ncbi:hypothetical protein [Ruminococcus flavefaciens]|uniref:hypothetical protein n=1 Tax=Ruminococcus flavefaciens TaxID=1265 RepID=UPI0026EADB7F|nr:hypothetical protein [Ruminococcus flavefaciens]